MRRGPSRSKSVPERCADESHVPDSDRARVEEMDLHLRALLGELRSGFVDFGPVELVVAEDVDDVRSGDSALAEALDAAWAVGREVPGEDDDVRLGDVRRDRAAVLEVQVGEDLNLQSGGCHPLPDRALRAWW